MREDLFLLRDAARKADKPDAALAEAVDSLDSSCSRPSVARDGAFS
jgi:hypothetical protein